MKTRIIREKCIGCTLCVAACPDVYEMDAEDKAVVTNETVPNSLENDVRDAASDCPTEAIEVDE